MKREVLIYNQIEGLHNYPDAGKNVSLLLGMFKDNADARQEFYKLIDAQK